MDLSSIVAGLLEDTAAVGVWVLGRKKVGDKEPFDAVLAGAVRESSIQPPRIATIGDEPLMFGLDDNGVYAERIGSAVLAFVFDGRTSLGVIRLRARKAREAIASVVISIVASHPGLFGPN